MPRVCTVCQSPARAEIDAALAKGEPALSISSKTGVGARAIGRHRLAHLSPALTAIAGEREGKRVGGLVDRLEAVTVAAERMLFAAETNGQAGQMQGWVREFRACVELMAKLTGQLAPERPNVTVNVLASPEVQTLVTVLLRSLQPFPEARIAAASALDTIDVPALEVAS
jgi:hypothetical protein